MKKDKIWIFAGTTEGRLLTRYASQMKMKCCVSTATEYGKSVLGENEGIRVIPGRMDQSKMRAFIRENNIGLAVDATHPFARQVTENICAACEEEKIKYVRCLRERETNDPADHAGETSDGRPISAANKIEDLFSKRKAAYESWSDFEIENTGIEETASNIAKMLGYGR